MRISVQRERSRELHTEFISFDLSLQMPLHGQGWSKQMLGAGSWELGAQSLCPVVLRNPVTWDISRSALAYSWLESGARGEYPAWALYEISGI